MIKILIQGNCAKRVDSFAAHLQKEHKNCPQTSKRVLCEPSAGWVVSSAPEKERPNFLRANRKLSTSKRKDQNVKPKGESANFSSEISYYYLKDKNYCHCAQINNHFKNQKDIVADDEDKVAAGGGTRLHACWLTKSKSLEVPRHPWGIHILCMKSTLPKQKFVKEMLVNDN